MHPAIRDEIYHIAREAIVNAFRHSQATKIEVRLKFTWQRVHLMVLRQWGRHPGNDS
jgi:signal transduction histidine kinase